MTPNWKEEYVHLLRKYKDLEAQNADLVAALRFYANTAIIEDDGGEIARQALSKAEK